MTSARRPRSASPPRSSRADARLRSPCSCRHRLASRLGRDEAHSAPAAAAGCAVRARRRSEVRWRWLPAVTWPCAGRGHRRSGGVWDLAGVQRRSSGPAAARWSEGAARSRCPAVLLTTTEVTPGITAATPADRERHAASMAAVDARAVARRQWWGERPGAAGPAAIPQSLRCRRRMHSWRRAARSVDDEAAASAAAATAGRHRQRGARAATLRQLRCRSRRSSRRLPDSPSSTEQLQRHGAFAPATATPLRNHWYDNGAVPLMAGETARAAGRDRHAAGWLLIDGSAGERGVTPSRSGSLNRARRCCVRLRCMRAAGGDAQCRRSCRCRGGQLNPTSTQGCVSLAATASVRDGQAAGDHRETRLGDLLALRRLGDGRRHQPRR